LTFFRFLFYGRENLRIRTKPQIANPVKSNVAEETSGTPETGAGLPMEHPDPQESLATKSV